MAEQPHRLGNLPDHYDERDYSFFTPEEAQTLVHNTKIAAAPVTADTSVPYILSDPPPVYDQRYIGSCTANATLAALRFAHHKYTGKPYPEFEPSRLFTYWNARRRTDPELLGSEYDVPTDVAARIAQDTGSQNRTCILSFNMDGVCSEKLWPYGDPSSNEDPPNQFYHTDSMPNPCDPQDLSTVEWEARPASHPLPGQKTVPSLIPGPVSFYRIYDPTKDTRNVESAVWKWNSHPPIALLEQSLKSGFPFVFAKILAQGADLRKDVDANGCLPKPPTPFVISGRHALLCIGYDSSNRRFLVQNSWGTAWPQSAPHMKGTVWIPYEWFEQSTDSEPLTSDFWVIKFSGK